MNSYLRVDFLKKEGDQKSVSSFAKVKTILGELSISSFVMPFSNKLHFARFRRNCAHYLQCQMSDFLSNNIENLSSRPERPLFLPSTISLFLPRFLVLNNRKPLFIPRFPDICLFHTIPRGGGGGAVGQNINPCCVLKSCVFKITTRNFHSDTTI